ncbi:hypothetical protein N9V86_03365, partial [Opitutales bacterium]|nr:hypothetical protein [Opitutales bacterium]
APHGFGGPVESSEHTVSRDHEVNLEHLSRGSFECRLRAGAGMGDKEFERWGERFYFAGPIANERCRQDK